ncbi:kinase-like domain-containing protein, partial [Pisolithus marmoratus]
VHSQGVLHGDLNGVNNILFDTKGNPFIVDYGLLPLILEFAIPQQLSMPVWRAARWIAPDLSQILPGEDHPNAGLSFEGDISSFGSVMLQVLTGKVPYHYIEHDEDVIFAIGRSLRPNCPQDIADEHWNCIQKCWAANPEDRPSAGELVSFFHQQCMT